MFDKSLDKKKNKILRHVSICSTQHLCTCCHIANILTHLFQLFPWKKNPLSYFMVEIQCHHWPVLCIVVSSSSELSRYLCLLSTEAMSFALQSAMAASPISLAKLLGSTWMQNASASNFQHPVCGTFDLTHFCGWTKKGETLQNAPKTPMSLVFQRGSASPGWKLTHVVDL